MNRRGRDLVCSCGSVSPELSVLGDWYRSQGLWLILPFAWSDMEGGRRQVCVMVLANREFKVVARVKWADCAEETDRSVGDDGRVTL